MAKQEDVFKKVISHAKEYGFIFPSSEIYDGLSAVYDYGQNGAELKNNIKQYWWKAMVQLNENIVGIDSAILMHPTTWKASGHVDAFNDPLIDNKDSKKRFRADVLVEDYCAKIEDKVRKDFLKKKSYFENFNEFNVFCNKTYALYRGYLNIDEFRRYRDFIKDLKESLANYDINNLIGFNHIVVDDNYEIVDLANKSQYLISDFKSFLDFKKSIYYLNYNDIRILTLDNYSDTKKRVEDIFEKYDRNLLIENLNFLLANERLVEKIYDCSKILSRLAKSLENEDLADVKALIEELEIADPDTGSKNWTEVRQFNLMFGTKLGASADSAMDLYLRPETAQGIFVNFLNVQKTSRHRLPFGIAQIGKAFRNEIVARQFIFRMREFEQMEMQFFVAPGTELEFYEQWKQKRLNWHLALGLGNDNYRFHDHEKLAHYANAAADIEFNFPFGFKELEGIHSRTDFDLKAHEKFSGRKLQFFDPERNENYVPYVVETSVGLDRLFLSLFSHCLRDEVLEDGSERTVLSLPPALAPIKAAILPLMKKDGLAEYAEKIFDDLKYDFNLFYEEKDAIGKRYRRQDAIGTPYCITIDHDSLTEHTVTIRDRDTMQQERVPVSELRRIIDEKTNFRNLLSKI
ncbi:glycine--tRNA ligase [Chryseobacterium formosus]|uniref:Glycine--tRNA ligase n=1 Tax=Chryseobacterium formosus TaxID=1537363 RepID=A0ABT3XMP7_9FLAO|nr:glycine--tRNA ligase [Chryseobacterium formosus]MCX8522431.1 glycine--tRNA ligase [Chryseobacterium formosus]